MADPIFSNVSRPNVAALDTNAFLVVYDPSTTGFKPLSLSDLSAGSFNLSFTAISSGVYSIPVGVSSWSLTVESGNAFINGAGPVNAGNSINGGGYGGFKTAAAINVGITGGWGYLSYEY